MSKRYLLILSIVISQASYSQCPVINGALINACAADGVTEGINEFVYFTTGASGAVSLYKLSYGSRNPPATQNPTAYLSGADAAAKVGPGSVIVQPGKTLTEVTSSSTIIPAGSSVVFIPYNLDQAYDLSALCKNDQVYVVYINIDNPTDSRWMPGGTMANAAAAERYIQIAYNGDDCTGNVRSYEGALWPNPGNTPEAEGNSLAWDDQDSLSYLNNGCSEIIVTPVKLVSFNAAKNGNDVAVKWKTANELNTKEFQVEWSADGRNFSPIGTVNAVGNSDVPRNYAFTHRQVAAGNNFYRLKILDANGSFVYSPIVKLNFTGRGSIKIYPSITHGELHVELNATKQEATTVMVLDLAGRLLSSRKMPVLAGYNRIDLTVNNLPAGEYILKLVNNSDNIITRFVKM
ncbi:MAG TPA: T9SS type A sorting domain-containing protein [Ferruginibacter sp.]|nr:T9SS type A sorting domain-containing protein [Ferruginibacter sp.]